MKVIHFLNTSEFSGAENVVCQIIRMMKCIENFEMFYCSRDGKVREALDERGISFLPISDMNYKEIKRIIKENEPDVVYAHDMKASFVVACACGNIPMISHIHNNAFSSRKLSLKSVAYYCAAIKAKHIFWVSQSAYEGYAFQKTIASKSSILRNVIDVEALYDKMKADKSQYPYDVVFLGRLSYEKNPQRLIEVFHIVAEKEPAAKFGIIGSGALEDELTALVKEYDIEQNVSFLGFQKNPTKILHDAKVMVMTSRWEGTPMCALEAMALGVPIVSTPTDGLKEIVEHGVTGFLSDDNEELAMYILSLIRDDKMQKEFSDRVCAEAVKINNKETYRSSIKQILDNLLCTE